MQASCQLQAQQRMPVDNAPIALPGPGVRRDGRQSVRRVQSGLANPRASSAAVG